MGGREVFGVFNIHGEQNVEELEENPLNFF